MKLAVLLSGGKDSLYATYLAGKENEIACIISMISENPESYMFHVPNVDLVKKQAEAMGIPILQKATKGVKEEELKDLEAAIREAEEKYNIMGVVSGAVASNYQKQRIDNICNKVGIKSLAPLWQQDAEELLREMIKKFRIVITAVGAPPLDEGWLERSIDDNCVDELAELNKKYGIHILFEGGEGETLVLECPIFSKRIEILDSMKHWDKKTRSG